MRLYDRYMTTAAAQTSASILEEKIASRRARVGIVGLGYVGLPLAVEFAKSGFSVTGIDLDARKTAHVNAGESYVGDISSAVLSKLVQEGKLRATTDFAAVRDLDTINICVPTPLRKTKDPDMSYIVSSCEEILKYLHAGMLVSWNRPPIPAPPTNCCSPCSRNPACARDTIFSCAFRRNAWIPATPSTRPPTSLK
jgi:UDP-N-acetyl-D-glucosamine dehydrogenase